jgi:hypothetical protein
VIVALADEKLHGFAGRLHRRGEVAHLTLELRGLKHAVRNDDRSTELVEMARWAQRVFHLVRELDVPATRREAYRLEVERTTAAQPALDDVGWQAAEARDPSNGIRLYDPFDGHPYILNQPITEKVVLPHAATPLTALVPVNTGHSSAGMRHLPISWSSLCSPASAGRGPRPHVGPWIVPAAIRLELTKSGRRREVPLSSNADAVLARRWAPEAKGYVFGSRNWNSFGSAWESALVAAGIEDLRFHDLRHTLASWLIQRGRTLREVQEALEATRPSP